MNVFILASDSIFYGKIGFVIGSFTFCGVMFFWVIFGINKTPLLFKYHELKELY